MDKDRDSADHGVDEAFLERLENAFNKTLSGLAIFARDVNLPENLAKKYGPGMIIREKAFVDASYKIGGMITTHRYMILSNHMADLEEYENDTNWGLCVAARDSHFKVLTVHEYDGKTMILLLHLPNDEDWELFVDLKTNVDEELISASVERFEARCNTEAVPELTAEVWLDRCSFPIGMDADGNFFDLRAVNDALSRAQ